MLDTAITSLIISFISLYVAIRIAWETTFRPAKLIGILSHIIHLSKNGKDEDNTTMRVIIPKLLIRNVGARTTVIENIRLVFPVDAGGGTNIYAYPESKITLNEIFDNKNKYSENGKNTFPVDIDGLFSGFALTKGEAWGESYSYLLQGGNHKDISGKLCVSVEVKERNRKWKQVEITDIDFEESFNNKPEGSGIEISINRSRNPLAES